MQIEVGEPEVGYRPTRLGVLRIEDGDGRTRPAAARTHGRGQLALAGLRPGWWDRAPARAPTALPVHTLRHGYVVSQYDVAWSTVAVPRPGAPREPSKMSSGMQKLNSEELSRSCGRVAGSV